MGITGYADTCSVFVVCAGDDSLQAARLQFALLLLSSAFLLLGVKG